MRTTPVDLQMHVVLIPLHKFIESQVTKQPEETTSRLKALSVNRAEYDNSGQAQFRSSNE